MSVDIDEEYVRGSMARFEALQLQIVEPSPGGSMAVAAARAPRVDASASGEPGSRVALRYVARAGLLPELSRQTYDSFAKALREAILNSYDAGATRIDVDLSRIASHDRDVRQRRRRGMTKATSASSS